MFLFADLFVCVYLCLSDFNVGVGLLLFALFCFGVLRGLCCLIDCWFVFAVCLLIYVFNGGWGFTCYCGALILLGGFTLTVWIFDCLWFAL